MKDPLSLQLLGEFVGTALLVLLGDGVVAGVNLNKSKAQGAGWVAITIGWGIAVTLGVYASAFLSPGHLNPAVSLGMAVAGKFPWAYVLPYSIVQIAGGFVGAALVWLHYGPHWRATDDQEAILSTFATVPAIRSYAANFISELIGTMVLLFSLLTFTRGDFTAGLNPLVVGVLILAIGLSLGGPTGYAINPARDLGPRMTHAVFPIANKGSSDWAYSWVPVIAPMVGGGLGAWLFTLIP